MERIIKTLEDGYQIIESDTRNVDFCGVAGWISYWIVDKNGEQIMSFPSVQRAERWFEMNKDNLDEPFNAEVEKLARSLTRRMGIKWETLSEEEKQEWIDEVSG